MIDKEKKRQELLKELARRFKDSANNLKNVARRIDKAARVHEDMRKRMDRASERLRECIDDEAPSIPWTYLEYVEFADAEEFKKFKSMEVITDAEIESVNWDTLSSKLFEK
ncbi:MAG: hypothetical protein JXR97_14485 [Planctomycetes bacterium]|nr:hypothetical protein [Planctomycetota bacterium]